MATRDELTNEARRLAALLELQQRTLVLAESCTGGLVAATLATVPGISRWLCGSAVVYQEATKTAWLGVPRPLLDEAGAVSGEVAAAMARGALLRTPQAMVAASVTGHLGPQAPQPLDGLIYAAVAVRSAAEPSEPEDSLSVRIREHRLPGEDAGVTPGTNEPLRTRRQVSAAHFVLQLVCSVLETPPPAEDARRQ